MDDREPTTAATQQSILPARPLSFGALLRVGWCAILGLLSNVAAAGDDVGIKVPPGFEISLYADDQLAHDIYSMTIDAQGRVVVSGAGYVRILIDEDGDGRADSFRQFADGPQSGAQGMAFHGRDLLCTGDAGLIRYRDSNGDDRADGEPDVFLKIKTGSEHHAHAIRRGPDGWWYLIAGNFADVDGTYATLPTSPVRKPHGGTLLRFKPDLAGGEIVADGFRNSYDFAIHPAGDLFVFDSDGERDVSLPWYRPTRVFHAMPGSNAGWVSRSWKRPGYFADMPPVVAEFGRGSPTGVACYNHRQFPPELHGALFVLDWTFGRVMALPLHRQGSGWSSEPIAFMTGVGQFGFAPTDVAVGPDGSLFVCVGGRGTRGSVYRVRYVGEDHQTVSSTAEAEPESKLARCLTAPQPLSSWSRAVWYPLARQLGRSAFVEAALDAEQPAARRIRAVEILTDVYEGLDTVTLLRLGAAESPELRGRAVWSAGRTGLIARHPKLLLPFLKDTDPLVVRIALETLVGQRGIDSLQPLHSALARHLAARDRFVRQTAARVVSQLGEPEVDQLAEVAAAYGPQAAVTLHSGRVLRTAEFNADALAVGLKTLEGRHSSALSLEAVRLVQLAIGDVGPQDGRPPVFDSYATQADLFAVNEALEAAAVRLAALYPTGSKRLDDELSRTLAMLAPDNGPLLDRVLARITDTSHPVDDIHQLIVAARLPALRTAGQRDKTAAALVALDEKIADRQLNLDTNWDERMGEMYETLVRADPALPEAIINQPGFGRPGHVLYLSELSEESLPEVVAAFVSRIKADSDYPWTNDVAFLLGASGTPAQIQMVREQFDSYAVRSAVLIVLSKKPDVQDRGKFVQGLASSQLPVLSACLDALEKLPPEQQPAEQFALLRTLRRLGENSAEYALREKVVELLRRNTRQDFGFEPGKEGYKPQPEVIRQWTAHLTSRHPQIAARELGGGTEDVAQFKNLMASVDWDAGDAARGRVLFEKRSCVQCHGGRRALGPDLAGAARRFSREDLFVAIAFPNRDVSPRYQTTLIETTRGKVYTGLIIYESVDGVLLRNAANQTFRIEADEIERQQTRPTSLMPAGLLKDLKQDDLADLYKYLSGL